MMAAQTRPAAVDMVKRGRIPAIFWMRSQQDLDVRKEKERARGVKDDSRVFGLNKLKVEVPSSEAV